MINATDDAITYAGAFIITAMIITFAVLIYQTKCNEQATYRIQAYYEHCGGHCLPPAHVYQALKGGARD